MIIYTKNDRIDEKMQEERIKEVKLIFDGYSMCSPFVHFTSSKYAQPQPQPQPMFFFLI